MDFGNLELRNAPSKIIFQKPLVSTEPLILGRKEKTITMSVVDSRAISSNWYLYAYIDNPLSTADGKYSLPDSLIYVDKNNKITTLGNSPTLIFSGTENEGVTKTTDIEWKENSGILSKVISPLYNGESYSTLINWILSNKLLE